MSVASHPLRITERDVIKEHSLDEWFNSFKGLDLHIRVGGEGGVAIISYVCGCEWCKMQLFR